MVEKIEKMWRENLEFQKAIVSGFDFGKLSYENKVQLTKEYLLHGITETDELLEATGDWKTVHEFTTAPRISGITQELVDKFKFLVNIALIWGISSDDFIEEFHRKTEVNWQKYVQNSLPHSDSEQIAVFDLDGVLCQYPEKWIEYLNIAARKITDAGYRVPSLKFDTIKNLHKISNEWNQRLNAPSYNELKHMYRETGQNKYISIMTNARETLKSVKQMGYKIVIMTRRPVKTYKRLYSDTLIWLKAFSIPFDGIYWVDGAGQKCNYLKENFRNIAFVVEDDPIEILALLRSSFKVFVLDRPYNKEIEYKPAVTGSLAEGDFVVGDLNTATRLLNLYDLFGHIKEV